MKTLWPHNVKRINVLDGGRKILDSLCYRWYFVTYFIKFN